MLMSLRRHVKKVWKEVMALASTQVNPTRMELTTIEKKADHGHPRS